jgi:hypothetical protein
MRCFILRLPIAFSALLSRNSARQNLPSNQMALAHDIGHQIEGVLIAQLVVANEAALDLYRRALACDPSRHFEAHTNICSLLTKPPER